MSAVRLPLTPDQADAHMADVENRIAEFMGNKEWMADCLSDYSNSIVGAHSALLVRLILENESECRPLLWDLAEESMEAFP